jgi:hypothetical protein
LSGRRIGAFFFASIVVATGAVAMGQTGESGLGSLQERRPIGVDAKRGAAAWWLDSTARDTPPDVAPSLLPGDWFGRPVPHPVVRDWQKSKSPRLAMFGSFLVPGFGQLYNEREFWALVAAGTEFYFIGTVIAEQRQTNRWRVVANATDDPIAEVEFKLHRDNRSEAAWLLALTALLSGVQSYVDANMFDFDETPLPEATSLNDASPAAAVRLHF